MKSPGRLTAHGRAPAEVAPGVTEVTDEADMADLIKKADARRSHAISASENAKHQSLQSEDAELNAKALEAQADKLENEGIAAEKKATELFTRQEKLADEMVNSLLELERQENEIDRLQKQQREVEREKQQIEATDTHDSEERRRQLKAVTARLSGVTVALDQARQARESTRRWLGVKRAAIKHAEEQSAAATRVAEETARLARQGRNEAKQARSRAEDLIVSKTLAAKKAMHEEMQAEHAALEVSRLTTQRDRAAFQRETRTNKTLTLSVQIVVGVFSLIFLYVLAFDQNILVGLSQANFARGLITFTIAVGTIIIAVLLVLIALMGNHEDSAKRFTRGKEILTILIGVLGTIVGFYYGATGKDSETAANMTVSSPVTMQRNGAPGPDTRLVYRLKGGLAPYE